MNLKRTPEAIIFEKLYPEEYKSFGCGPGGVGDWFVPDRMWFGVSVKDACRQHDHDYRFGIGASDEHRKECDDRMKENMHIIVHEKSDSWILKQLRHIRINTYYVIVRVGGGSSYWGER